MRNLLLAATTSTALAGCEVPVMIAAAQNQGEMTGMFEITFPAVLLTQLETGEEELMTGQLIGHISGSSRYELTGPTWGTCSGGLTADGISTMTCENGVGWTIDLGEQETRMSGIEIQAGEVFGTQFISVFAWGNDASEVAVRAAIADYS
ncbi:hypothetical protein [Pontivivens insulae]|uniref:Uncharacterized protein n=1 Tax=Pontivivens insulae TaxID=1639689 RepID=A0A2R8AF08_9RHOB|nr:hypothetical protein [Pontivivens insulae]RED12030.1 hypothetical protein DFR53_2743 [Pontivivens insulae]SPF30786.1 hypothetical protein POI8812_03129 [Pontivivens insulae]